jgi:hypothetical protein
MLKEAVMTYNQNTHKPPVTDLWLLVDEEQTMHFGMRQTWRWLETEQPLRRPTSQAAVAATSRAHAPVCCQPAQVVCAA